MTIVNRVTSLRKPQPQPWQYVLDELGYLTPQQRTLLDAIVRQRQAPASTTVDTLDGLPITAYVVDRHGNRLKWSKGWRTAGGAIRTDADGRPFRVYKETK